MTSKVIHRSKDCRLLVVDVDMSQHTLRVMAVYGPTEATMQDRAAGRKLSDVRHKLGKTITKYTNPNTIIMGDFNATLSETDVAYRKTPRPKWDWFTKTIAEGNMVDMGGVMHNPPLHTRIRGGKSTSRLDYVLMHPTLLSQAPPNNMVVVPTPSLLGTSTGLDHEMIALQIPTEHSKPTPQRRKPGINRWTKKELSLWQQKMDQYKPLEGTCWERLKEANEQIVTFMDEVNGNRMTQPKKKKMEWDAHVKSVRRAFYQKSAAFTRMAKAPGTVCLPQPAPDVPSQQMTQFIEKLHGGPTQTPMVPHAHKLPKPPPPQLDHEAVRKLFTAPPKKATAMKEHRHNCGKEHRNGAYKHWWNASKICKGTQEYYQHG